jgi:hypothetical protein
VFSSAVRAFATPVCRSASTLVVPPGVSVSRFDVFGVAGETGALIELLETSRELSDWLPSSARARALPTAETGIPATRKCRFREVNRQRTGEGAGRARCTL